MANVVKLRVHDSFGIGAPARASDRRALQKCGPHMEHPPSPRLRRDKELREEKSWGQRYA